MLNWRSLSWENRLEEFQGMLVHDRAVCEGQPCAIHSATHHMKDWPIFMRSSSLVERVCEHGVGHPDPHSVEFLEKVTGQDYWGVHGCCGCCAEEKK